ncbi:MAG: hypothetical protein KGH75_01140 [Rhodospirillales bacterium]|nr:hypothetical protein [Rhodospirillales bacterium]
MPDGHIKPLDRMPILWIAMGRQRVGKTALLNTAVQYFRDAGNPVRVWNADQQNRSHTLSVFFPDAEEVPNAGLEDGKAWIEDRIEDLIKHRYDAVLDVGGGATGFSRLVQEVPLLEAIEGSAVRVVGLFCIGPETADLDYLEQFVEVDMFMPAATVVVLNGGLVMSGRSAGGAFKPIIEHAVIKSAVKKGARLAMMPALSCMSQVTDRGLTFAEAANGGAKKGGEPLALFDRARVNRWWTRDVPEFFGKLPREWLPLAATDARESEAS